MPTDLSDTALLAGFVERGDLFRRGAIDAETYRRNLIALLNGANAAQLAEFSARSPLWPIMGVLNGSSRVV